MQNPIILNTVNIIQFGFRTDFRIEQKKISFDIDGLTTFNTGGAAAVKGINFEVKDPTGTLLSVIDFPNKDITPASGTTYEITLSSGFAQFGLYKIKAVIRDADDKDYTIEIQKNIVKPKHLKNNVVEGKFEELTDCDAPRLTISEVTETAYSGLSPVSTSKVGMMYYPLGTLNPIPFSFTPFEVSGSGKVYTGTYVIRNKTICQYDLGDLVSVYVSYLTSKEFEVNCNSNLCRVLCCVDELYEEYNQDCHSQKGQNAKAKLDRVAYPLMLATLNEKCGKNSGDYVDEIEKIIGCKCGCDSEVVEPKPLLGTGGNSGGAPVILEGACATSVVPDTSGETIKYIIKTKSVTIQKLHNADLAFTINKTESECGFLYELSFNYSVLSETILNTISNSEELTQIFNSIVNQSTGIDIAGIDPKCIGGNANCDYEFFVSTERRLIRFDGVVIGGTLYPAPTFDGTDLDALLSWLNGLSKGTFTAFFTNDSPYPISTVVVRSVNNPNVVNAMNYTVIGVGGTSESIAFSRKCATLKSLIQAIINYICSLNTKQITLGDPLYICQVNTKTGLIEPKNYPGSTHLWDYLKDQAEAFCTLLNTIGAVTGINCKSILAVFIASPRAVTGEDFVLGTKDGICARIGVAELSYAMIRIAFNDTETRAFICKQIADCSAPFCEPVNNIIGTLTDPA